MYYSFDFRPYNLHQQRFFYICNIRAKNRIGPHNLDVISVIIGCLLGDAYSNRRSGEGIRIFFRQSIKHKEYLFWLYEFFYVRGYTSNLKPRKYTRIINYRDNVYYGYEFNTFTFRSLNWIHDLFYKKGSKVISPVLSKYFTPLALAVWIMNDGCWAGSGIRITTNSYTLKQVTILLHILQDKYKLDVYIQYIYTYKYSIYIKKNSIDKLKSIILPYIHKSMYYKLGIKE